MKEKNVDSYQMGEMGAEKDPNLSQTSAKEIGKTQVLIQILLP